MNVRKVEDGVYVSGQLLEADFAELARQGVRTVVNNRPDGEQAGQLAHEQAAAVAAGHGLEYHFIPVGHGGLNNQAVDSFAKVLAEAPRPILAYCLSGGRSSFLFMLARSRLNQAPGA